MIYPEFSVELSDDWTLYPMPVRGSLYNVGSDTWRSPADDNRTQTNISAKSRLIKTTTLKLANVLLKTSIGDWLKKPL